MANNPTHGKAYIVTGPTSGIGRQTALELARHGPVILVGRNPVKLDEMRRIIERRGQRAMAVVCDVSDPVSVGRVVAQITALGVPIGGLLNNAGILQMRATQNAIGWDMTFATNHLGPFKLTQELIPHLPDGATVLFVASAVEDPGRKPAVAAGFRGSRYLSAVASARGEWSAGGSARPGMDAYATSKQCTLVTAMVFARENPRLRINAVEPGVAPATNLGMRDLNPVLRAVAKTLVPVLVPLLLPFVKILSTPKRAARVLTRILLDDSGQTGIYFDEGGQPMKASSIACDSQFQDRVVAETRALLATLRAN